MSQGLYVSPESLELLYLESEFIEQIFIPANSHKDFLISVIVPNSNFRKIFPDLKGKNKIKKKNKQNKHNKQT